MKSGAVSIVGKPNVGKSTLINILLDRKVSIVSPCPAITRIRILGIYNSEEGQIVILDTPGFEKARDELGKMMMRTILGSMEDADIVLFMIGAKGWDEHDERILAILKKFNKKTILIINKVDKISYKESLLPIIKESKEKYDFVEIIPLSALKNINIDELRKSIFKYLPEGEKMFPEEMETNIPQEYTLAEIIREKAVNKTYQEIPQAIAVEIEEIKPGTRNKNMIIVKAEIIVDRENLKKIIIGKDGTKLKMIGKLAREEMEILLGKRVYLHLWVRVIENWRNRPDVFRKFGYGDI